MQNEAYKCSTPVESSLSVKVMGIPRRDETFIQFTANFLGLRISHRHGFGDTRFMTVLFKKRRRSFAFVGLFAYRVSNDLQQGKRIYKVQRAKYVEPSRKTDYEYEESKSNRKLQFLKIFRNSVSIAITDLAESV